VREEEVHRKALSGAVKLSSACPSRPLPDFESLVVCPSQLEGGFPKDIFEGIDTDLVIGEKTSSNPLTLMTPAFVPGVPFGEIGKGARLALAYGASLAGTVFGTGEGGMLPEEKEICKQFRGKSMVSWGPARHGLSLDHLRSGDAVLIELCGGGRGCFTALWKAERTNPAQAALWNDPSGLDWVSPPVHLDMDTPDDLKVHVSLMRELTEHRVPVILKLGAARIYEEAKLAIESEADAVWIEGIEAPLYAAPEVVVEEVGLPLLTVFGPARRAFEDTGAHERGVKLLVSGGIVGGGDVFKALALGADAVGVGEGARIALGCKEECGTQCHTMKCPAGIATLDPALEAKLDWKSAGKCLANYIAALTDELKLLCASAGHTSSKGASLEDLRALTYDAAALTGVKLAGYDKSLPMWLH
jgi:glutamate synthase domain-containing protein 2